MQISASNLLVAAQQPRTASQASQQLHSGFAQTLTAAKPEAGFEPMSFKPQANTQANTQAAPQGQSEPQAKPYTPVQAPGTRLDIRI